MVMARHAAITRFNCQLQPASYYWASELEWYVLDGDAIIMHVQSWVDRHVNAVARGEMQRCVAVFVSRDLIDLEGLPPSTGMEEYIQAAVSSVLVDDIEWQYEALQRGFCSVMAPQVRTTEGIIHVEVLPVGHCSTVRTLVPTYGVLMKLKTDGGHHDASYHRPNHSFTHIAVVKSFPRLYLHQLAYHPCLSMRRFRAIAGAIGPPHVFK